MTNGKKKTISRSLGEFVGHILRGAKTRVDDEGNEVVREEVNRTVEEEEHEGVTLRRTTIEEVEFKRRRSEHAASTDHDETASPDNDDT